MRIMIAVGCALVLQACGPFSPAPQHLQPGLWGMAVSFDPRYNNGEVPEPSAKICIAAEDAAANNFDPAKVFILPPDDIKPRCGKQAVSMKDGRIQSLFTCREQVRHRRGDEVIVDVEGKFSATSFDVKVYNYTPGPKSPERTGWDKKVNDSVGRQDPHARGFGWSVEGRRLGDC